MRSTRPARATPAPRARSRPGRGSPSNRGCRHHPPPPAARNPSTMLGPSAGTPPAIRVAPCNPHPPPSRPSPAARLETTRATGQRPRFYLRWSATTSTRGPEVGPHGREVGPLGIEVRPRGRELRPFRFEVTPHGREVRPLGFEVGPRGRERPMASEPRVRRQRDMRSSLCSPGTYGVNVTPWSQSSRAPGSTGRPSIFATARFRIWRLRREENDVMRAKSHADGSPRSERVGAHSHALFNVL